MRILAVSQNYWPEPFNVSKICEGLAERGNEVAVLTGIPNYPEGKVYQGYQARTGVVEYHNGVKVIRVPNRERKSGAFNRFINYCSFSHQGKKVAKKLSGDYDVVLSFQFSPVMSANPAIAYANRNHVPLLIYVIDIWPESLTAGGIKRTSLVFKVFSKISKDIYEKADRLAVTSLGFEGYIARLLGRSVNCCYLPQYAEDVFTENDVSVEGAADDSFPCEKVNVMFAGNIGRAQSLQTFVRAAALLKDEDFVFHALGSGVELGECQELALRLGADNVVFHGRRPVEEMPGYYSKADAMVATFADNPILGYTLPRKIQTYMAAGKPIIGAVTGEARRVLEEAQCGFNCNAEDAHGLAECIRKFGKLNIAERESLGANAQRYYREHYSEDDFFKTLVFELDSLGRRIG